MKRLSLSNRLLLTVSFVLAAFLSISAFSLNNAFHASADSAQQKRLKNYIYSLLTAAEFTESGLVSMPKNLAEPEFSLPNSGLYAQITSNKRAIWQSQSLLGQVLSLPENTSDSNEFYANFNVDSKTELLNLAYDIVWENERGQQFNYTFNVTEDLTTIKQQKAGFQRSLWYWLGGTGLGLLLIQLAVLRWSLRPLNDAANDLQAIEEGQQNRLSKNYPKELSQLTRNINTLLDHEESRRLRYKNSLADLAHSLKTPLAVIRGDLESSSDITSLKQNGQDQINRISDLIDYQLQRAATEGHSTLQAPLLINDVIMKTLSSLDKVYQDKSIQHHNVIENDIVVHKDEGDMYELLGNLLENAYKYCQQSVRISAEINADFLLLCIEDDGPGIPEAARQEILHRGSRIDTRIEGQGLGLAIANDIVTAYYGSIAIEKSELGGAKFIIKLPLR